MKNLFSGYIASGHIKQVIDCDAWFNTGDIVSINEQGKYIYHGRADRMLKISGYRIEPVEIENTINEFISDLESIVIGIKGRAGESYIIAFISSSFTIDLTALKKFVKSKLPTYMCPHRYIFLEQIPRLSNGKTDLLTLRKIAEADYATI